MSCDSRDTDGSRGDLIRTASISQQNTSSMASRASKQSSTSSCVAGCCSAHLHRPRPSRAAAVATPSLAISNNPETRSINITNNNEIGHSCKSSFLEATASVQHVTIPTLWDRILLTFNAIGLSSPPAYLRQTLCRVNSSLEDIEMDCHGLQRHVRVYLMTMFS